MLLLPLPCHTQAGEEIDEAELEAAACAMGYGAVKYADLKNARTTNYKFSFDAMLDLRGNTAVYLLYAHARIAAIVRKSGKDIDALAAGAAVVVEHPKEVELALALCRWVLERRGEETRSWMSLGNRMRGWGPEVVPHQLQAACAVRCSLRGYLWRCGVPLMHNQ
jgi:hypothetical protein